MRKNEYKKPKTGSDGMIPFKLKMSPEDHKFLWTISKHTNIPITSMLIIGGKREAIANKKRHAESGGDYGNR